MNFLFNGFVLNFILQLNLKWQKKNNKQMEHMPYIAWLKDYCTVKFNIGRRFGYSTYIRNHFKVNDLILTRTAHHAKYVKNLLGLHPYSNKVFSIEQFAETERLVVMFRGSTINIGRVWIDTSSIDISKETLDAVYETLDALKINCIDPLEQIVIF